MVAEPNEIILNFVVCDGQLDVLSGKDHVEKVVLNFMSDMLIRSHSLYMNNS